MIHFFTAVHQSIFPRIFISSLLMVTGFSTIAHAQASLTTESRLGTNGIGPVLTGMSLEEAIEASGLKFKTGAGNGACRHVQPIGGPKGLSFMVNDGTIAVTYANDSEIKTLRGAQIGDSESKIRSMYPGQLKPAESVSGRTKVLQFVPKDAEDRNYRIVFSFRQGKLINFRSGRLPEVLWIEGCF